MEFVLSVPMLHAEPCALGVRMNGAVWEYKCSKDDGTFSVKTGEVMFDEPIERALNNPIPHEDLLSLIRSKIDVQALETELATLKGN